MEDYLNLDQQLSSEEKMVRDTVRTFVQDEILPSIPAYFEKGQFPTEIIPKLAELGVLGLILPTEYGGSQANYVSYGLVCQELEWGDSAIRSFVSVQNSLCMYPIFTYGTEAQKKAFLPKMSKGECIGCFGLTEPDAGSDPNSLSTTAKRVQDGYILNGSKLWITNGTLADIAIVWAKTDAGIRGFIVEKTFKGFQANEIKGKLSLRASNTAELVFTDCFVPDTHYLPGTEKGLSAALGCLTQARYGIAWGAMGAAAACFESALAYCKERKQFNKPLAAFQLVQKDLVDMCSEILKAQCFNLHLGRLKDKNASNFALVSLAKMNACKEALKIARMARNLLGANGISIEYPIFRHMANLESVFTYEGTDNIHHLIVGKYITELDAFS